MLKRKQLIAGLILAAFSMAVSSCAVGPDFKRPETPEPERFAGAGTDARPRADLVYWWKGFQDPTLDLLVDEAINSNLNLQLATERVVEARELLQLSYGELIPSLSTHASLNRKRNSRNANSNSNGDNNSESSSTSAGTKTLYEAGFDSLWELDVFGGQRRTVEAAGFNYDSIIEAWHDALITLLSEVAQNYIILRGVQYQIAITARNIEAEKETLDIQQQRLGAGIANDLTVAQAEAQLHNTESQLPSLRTQEKQAIHRLGILIGREPTALLTNLSEAKPIPKGPAFVPPGIPSELLRRRPDIRKAERDAGTATALVGVAIAELFPKVTLTGSLGWRSEQFSTIDEHGSFYWSLGPNISLPIFDLGPLWSNAQVYSSRERQALITYRQTVINAFEEVENALQALKQEQIRRDSLRQSVDSTRRAFDLARQLNDAGVVDFLNVLNAQFALFVAEDLFARSEQTVSTNLVALYKALGGGWETFPEMPESLLDN